MIRNTKHEASRQANKSKPRNAWARVADDKPKGRVFNVLSTFLLLASFLASIACLHDLCSADGSGNGDAGVSLMLVVAVTVVGRSRSIAISLYHKITWLDSSLQSDVDVTYVSALLF